MPWLELDDPRDSWALQLSAVAVACYVGASMMANIMSLRAVVILGFVVDAGTLAYPLTFTLRDVVHKIGGARLARTTILVSAALNVVMALGLRAAAALAPDPAVGPQAEFGQVLSLTGRIVAASIVAQVIAEFIDTEIYRRYVARFAHRYQFGRVIVSNAISVPIDSVIFTVIAFTGTTLGPSIPAIIGANIAIKGATSMLTWPLIYSVPEAPSEEAGRGRKRAAAHLELVKGDAPPSG